MTDNAETWRHNTEATEVVPMETRNQSSDVSELMMALAKAQGEIGEIERDRSVKVQTARGGYEFRYATLAAIISAVKKSLSDNGIARTQVIRYDSDVRLYYLTTTLHYKNQFISSTVPLIISDGGNQQFGSSLTYMKRYSLAALIGVAADEDDDGNVADGNTIKSSQEKAKPKVAPNPMKEPEEATPVTMGKIDVPILPDGSGSDWMKWGQQVAATAKQASSLDDLRALEKANVAPLKNMEISVPKMFANLMVALIKVKQGLEKNG
jgi:hypothetical protein